MTARPDRRKTQPARRGAKTNFHHFRDTTGYYVEDTDTTALETFIAYAEREGLDGEEFKAAFESDAMRQETLEDFAWCQQAGVTGFPTMVLREDHDLGTLTVGYRPIEDLKPTLDAWTSGEFSLAQNAMSTH